jgi:hypothetical protein
LRKQLRVMEKKDNNYADEVWKELTFSESKFKKYEISNCGRIRSYSATQKKFRMLKQSTIRGYKYYSFKADKGGSKLIHRLVADMFLPRDNKMQTYVIHLDYDKSNNHVDNLKWVTKRTLQEHHKLNPNYKYERPFRITNSKLTESEVIRLKKKLLRGKNPLYKIAKEFGITHTQLNRIRSGENWSHVKID